LQCAIELIIPSAGSSAQYEGWSSGLNKYSALHTAPTHPPTYLPSLIISPFDHTTQHMHTWHNTHST
jgi:hypothetical protein